MRYIDVDDNFINSHLKMYGYPEKYPYSVYIPITSDLGVIWKWILNSEYANADFKWNDRTFFFKEEKDKLFFLLKWGSAVQNPG
jgi:hypothetical protein